MFEVDKIYQLLSRNIQKMALPYYLIFALPIFLLFVIQRYKKAGKTREPPGPPGLPILGNLHQIDTTNTHYYLWKLSKEYGPVMMMKLASKPLLVISSAKLTEEALKTNDIIFSGRAVLYNTNKLTYNATDMAFSAYNDYWREMRKICILRLFSLKQVQSFRPLREDEVMHMINQISKHASTGEVLNLSEIALSFTSTLICRIAFGKRYNEEGSERRRFDGLLREFQAMLGGTFFANFFPWLGWIDTLTGMSARLEKCIHALDSFSQELIDEHLDPNRPQEMKEDILSLLLQLKQEKSLPVDLSWENVKGLLLDIFVAGTETSAASTIWTMTALMKAPRVMKKVQAEIRNVGKKEGLLKEEDIQNFSYLRAVIKEVLRLYPPTPLLLPRETTEKCTIGGYDVPAKSIVYVNAWAVARDPEYWDNPNEFLPERFLDSKIDYKGQHFGYIPFGAGRRGCPGIAMGIVTVELVLANLLYSFDWLLPPGMTEEDVSTEAFPGLAMLKKTPLCLVAKKYVP